MSYVYDDVVSQIREVGDHLLVLLRDLGVLDQLCEVLLVYSLLDWMYRRMILILSLMDTFWSSRIGTMFLMWSRMRSPKKYSNYIFSKIFFFHFFFQNIFFLQIILKISPSASVPVARSCSTLHSLST